MLVCIAYLVTTWIDHRRRGKPLWIWRRVRRSNGTYIVGSQHILFVVMSAISCLIIIGFVNNGRRTLILRRYNDKAYFWRSLVYVSLNYTQSRRNRLTEMSSLGAHVLPRLDLVLRQLASRRAVLSASGADPPSHPSHR